MGIVGTVVAAPVTNGTLVDSATVDVVVVGSRRGPGATGCVVAGDAAVVGDDSADGDVLDGDGVEVEVADFDVVDVGVVVGVAAARGTTVPPLGIAAAATAAALAVQYVASRLGTKTTAVNARPTANAAFIAVRAPVHVARRIGRSMSQ
jgi:hypothetical protein